MEFASGLGLALKAHMRHSSACLTMAFASPTLAMVLHFRTPVPGMQNDPRTRIITVHEYSVFDRTWRPEGCTLNRTTLFGTEDGHAMCSAVLGRRCICILKRQDELVLANFDRITGQNLRMRSLQSYLHSSLPPVWSGELALDRECGQLYVVTSERDFYLYSVETDTMSRVGMVPAFWPSRIFASAGSVFHLSPFSAPNSYVLRRFKTERGRWEIRCKRALGYHPHNHFAATALQGQDVYVMDAAGLSWFNLATQRWISLGSAPLACAAPALLLTADLGCSFLFAVVFDSPRPLLLCFDRRRRKWTVLGPCPESLTGGSFTLSNPASLSPA